MGDSPDITDRLRLAVERIDSVQTQVRRVTAKVLEDALEEITSLTQQRDELQEALAQIGEQLLLAPGSRLPEALTVIGSLRSRAKRSERADAMVSLAKEFGIFTLEELTTALTLAASKNNPTPETENQ